MRELTAGRIFSENWPGSPNEFSLTVPRAAQYYISATPGRLVRSKTLHLEFDSESKRDLAAVILNSNFFFWLYRCLGDGLLVNVDILGRCPVFEPKDKRYLDLARTIYDAMPECLSFKRYRGEDVPNYNFNKRLDLLIACDKWIMGQLGIDDLPETFFANSKSNSVFKAMSIPKVGLSGKARSEPEGD